MKINDMWNRLAQHQPYADERGYGPAWAKMCAERTSDAASKAEEAAAMSAWAAAADAAWAAEQAAEAAEEAARAAKTAVQLIEDAEGRE